MKRSYCGLVSATSQTLGLQSILLDGDGNSNPMCGWMSQREFRLEADEGLGRVKHIDTVFLWMQAMVTEGKILLGKKPTKEMLADLLTKHVDAAALLNGVTGLGLRFQSGESKLTVKA